MTAKEFLKTLPKDSNWELSSIVENAMIEFAKYRISEVKNQILKEVYDNIEYLQTLEIDEFECITIENLEIILNNIK